MINWFVKGLISYLRVKEKTYVTTRTFVSTIWLSTMSLSLNTTVGHYATPLVVVARGSVVESD